jgi:lipopolysaccharide transport system ATP-binding protein
MSRPIIEVCNLAKRYNLGAVGTTSVREEASRLWDRLRGRPHPNAHEFWALRDVSFAVQPGEVMGVIGRNGAGKSTLLKILSRITDPTSGTAKLRGRVASLLEVGTGFHPELTGRENVFLNGAILGMSRSEVRRKFDEIVAFAEVEQFIDTPVKRYSSGMYVRLAFAVAAHLEPEILIVDEVLAVGDASFQKKCLSTMESASRGSGRTVLFVSHNLGAVRSLCQTCLWLEGGRARATGLSSAIVDDYLRATGRTAGLSFDLSDVERDSDRGSQVRITNIAFNRSHELLHGEPLAIDVTLEILSPATDVAVGVGFSTPEGTRLMTIESDLPGPRLTYANRGRYVLHAKLDRLHLQPGPYSIDVGVRSGEFNALDFLQGVANVEVLPGPTTRGTLIRGGGNVRYPSDWH